MKLLVLIGLLVFSVQGQALSKKVKNDKVRLLAEHKWHAGSRICWWDRAPAIEVYRYDPVTYILRQNKCGHYEAPFMYLLFGDETLFIQDTGALSAEQDFPLFDTVWEIVQEVAAQQGKSPDDYKLLVTHSHSHGDHVAADAQFIGKPNVSMIKPELSAIQKAFGYGEGQLQWPQDNAQIDLGGRQLTLFPIPGHHADAVAIYDPHTSWLLTGDSLYPGRLYVKDWQAFKTSIARLWQFAKSTEISAVMGTHIEMSKEAGEDYKMGSTYQPNEAPLPLSKSDLSRLFELLQTLDAPTQVVEDKFILYPLK